ncbi:MAG: hypothetical protein U9N06_04650 [candidate division WOR-3 bacterium]|nr:hypothetical protein [candidate division WOR-3 bacterium]
MILLALILVEEDKFEPKLPTPEIKPNVSWVYSMKKDWFYGAVEPHLDYHLFSLALGDFRILSLHERDFADHYSLEFSLGSLSYNFKADYTNWNDKEIKRLEGWKWFSYGSNLFFTWTEGMNFGDSTLYGGGIRYYHSFPNLFWGGWVNYLDTPDYGSIVQYRGFRVELGVERRCAGYIGDLGNIKVGKFRDRFPSVFFPLRDFYPRILNFYGTKINILDLKITAGRRYYYTKGRETLQWKKGISDFAIFGMEKKHLGFQFVYQTRGAVKEFGKAYHTGSIRFLCYRVSLTGYLTPLKYLSSGLSIWTENKFSPFVSIRNISWSPNKDLMEPLYYIGIHYVH